MPKTSDNRGVEFWERTEKDMKNRSLWGVLLCFVAAASWGAMFPVAHAAFAYIDPFYFTIIRYGTVSILLAALLLWKEGWRAFRLEGRGLKLWFYGTMAFAVYNLLMFWGEDLLGEPGVMVASIMESLMPMISIVIAWLCFRKRPHSFTLLCVAVSFVGAMLVITKGDLRVFAGAADQLVPSLLIFMAVVGWVIYTMGAKQFGDWSALRYSTLSCLLGTLTSVIVVAVATMAGYIEVPTGEVLRATAPHLAFMIVLPGLIAVLGWNIGVGILSPINALLFINFVPVTTLVVSAFQGNGITKADLMGTVLIILALLSNNLFARMAYRKRRRAPMLVPAAKKWAN